MSAAFLPYTGDSQQSVWSSDSYNLPIPSSVMFFAPWMWGLTCSCISCIEPWGHYELRPFHSRPRVNSLCSSSFCFPKDYRPVLLPHPAPHPFFWIWILGSWTQVLMLPQWVLCLWVSLTSTDSVKGLLHFRGVRHWLDGHTTSGRSQMETRSCDPHDDLCLVNARACWLS